MNEDFYSGMFMAQFSQTDKIMLFSLKQDPP